MKYTRFPGVLLKPLGHLSVYYRPNSISSLTRVSVSPSQFKPSQVSRLWARGSSAAILIPFLTLWTNMPKLRFATGTVGSCTKPSQNISGSIYICIIFVAAFKTSKHFLITIQPIGRTTLRACRTGMIRQHGSE